jgi:hypothetical protein
MGPIADARGLLLRSAFKQPVADLLMASICIFGRYISLRVGCSLKRSRWASPSSSCRSRFLLVPHPELMGRRELGFPRLVISGDVSASLKMMAKSLSGLDCSFDDTRLDTMAPYRIE